MTERSPERPDPEQAITGPEITDREAQNLGDGVERDQLHPPQFVSQEQIGQATQQIIKSEGQKESKLETLKLPLENITVRRRSGAMCGHDWSFLKDIEKRFKRSS